MEKEKEIYVTIYEGDGSDDEVYELKVKAGKSSTFWHDISILCETVKDEP